MLNFNFSYIFSFRYDDGSTFSFERRERPHLVFAEDGFTIVGLTTGVAYTDSTTQGSDACFTFLQPVRTEPVRTEPVRTEEK